LITGGGWALFFGCVAALMSRVPTHPGAWVALFVGVALSGCFAVANYHRALRRLHAGTSASDAKSVSKVRTFLKWCSSSLRGHIVLYQLLGAVPMFILFTYLNYTEGTLTFSWGIWIAFVAECFALFMALFQWFTLSRWFVYLRRDTERMKALLAKRKAAGDQLPDPRRF
jgi:hypothetical protein